MDISRREHHDDDVDSDYSRRSLIEPRVRPRRSDAGCRADGCSRQIRMYDTRVKDEFSVVESRQEDTPRGDL